MQYQDNQTAPGNLENQPIMYQPYYPPPPPSNNQVTYSPPINQNYQPNQFYEKPQITNQDNNNYSMVPQQQINTNNQYFVLPEEEPSSKYIKGNKLEIPIKLKCCNIFIFIYVFSTSVAMVIAAPSFHRIYLGAILLIEIFSLLYYDIRKIVIIKDEGQRKIIIKEIHICCKEGKKFEFDLESVNFIVNQKSILFILNNCKNKKEIDLNTSSIRNYPLKFLFFFENINVNKFNGQYQLNKILNDFVGLPNDQENPLNFNINAYIQKQQAIANQYNFNKYIKINDNFFTYYNNDPIKRDFMDCLIKTSSCIIHLYVFGFTAMISNDDVSAPLTIFVLVFYYLVIFGFGFLICKSCKKNKSKCLRIDIIYSLDFNKIFIGSSNVGEKTYISFSEFYINDIERFILQKNNPNDEGFSLIALLKGNQCQQILYVKDDPLELEGLIYILNERLVNNNNIIVGQQGFNEFPIPIVTSC